MKKMLALLLSLVCLFTCVSLPVSAIEDIPGNIGDSMGLPPDEPVIYGIVYEVDKLEGVTIMYKPSPTFTFTSPGTYTVTNDTPLSVDYEFVCWQHEETGKYYYAGDQLYIDGQETLIAVWQPKTDNHLRPTRVLLTALETLRRTIGSFLGFYKVIDDFKADLKAPKPTYNYYSMSDLGVEIINTHTNEKYEADPRTYILVIKSDSVFDAAYETVNVNFFGDKYTDTTTGNTYTAHFSLSSETMEYDGKQCQYIKVTLVDGVPTPVTGTFITLTIPAGFLKYDTGVTNAEGMPTYAANAEYVLNRFLSTTYV